MRNKVYFFSWRRLSMVGAFLFFALFSLTVKAQDVSSGLLVHYTMDNVTDGVIADETANFPGTLVGGAAVVEGYLGSAVECVAVDDYIQLPGNVFENVGDFSFAAWVKVNSLENWSRIFDLGQTDQSNISYFTTNQGGGSPKFTIYRNGGTDGYLDVFSNQTFPTGVWVHVAITIENGTTGTMYFNGEVVGTGEYNMNESTVETIGFTDLGDVAGITNFIGKSHWADGALNGKMDDIRIYNRGLTAEEVAELASETSESELLTQFNSLDLGDLTFVTEDLDLPTTLGTQGVTVDWTVLSGARYLTAEGAVTRPAKYDQPVKFRAVVKQPGVTTDSLMKSFTAIIIGEAEIEPGILAEWDFSSENIFFDGDTLKVKDVSGSDFVGSVKDVARIRTIGETTQYNVLDLGNGEGYFDMGEEIGEAVYSLADFTVGGYYRMDADYADNGAWGNNLYSFSNAEYLMTNAEGTSYICLGNSNYGISETAWNVTGENGINPSLHPATGEWHHILYVQQGATGTIYIDGEQVATGGVELTPSTALYRDTLNGTKFNWIGRPPYMPSGDVFLRKTLVYDFMMANVPLTADDVEAFDFMATVEALNAAYEENSDNISDDLAVEVENLKNLSWDELSENLPTAGITNPDVSISWKSSREKIISTSGEITAPEYMPAYVKMTAVLSFNSQTANADFVATVLPTTESAYSSDLLVNFNFAADLIDATDTMLVKDASEKAFEGKLVNGAQVLTMTGMEGDYDLVYLPNDTAYFDMGDEVGKVAYGLGKNYSTSIWYYIDDTKTNLTANGNFVYTFANSDSSDYYHTGYMFGRPASNEQCVSEFYWAAGNQAINNGDVAPELGMWHHFAYVQNDTLGVVYLDGDTVSVGNLTNYPGYVLPKDSMVGTMANFLGRANFSGDAYLGKAFLSDFRLYKKSLDYDEITDLFSKAGDMEFAMLVDDPRAVKEIAKAPSVKVYSPRNGEISIVGNTANEKVYVYDLTGRLVQVAESNSISVAPGLHLVRVGQTITKVIVR